MKKILFSILILNLSACSIVNAPTTNRKAIQTSLYEGMSKADLLKRLGEPYKIDHVSFQEEIVYYETDLLAGSFCLQYTAIRLLNDKINAWGNSVCQEPKQAVDVEAGKLDNYLKQ